jgi:hypothetical protein
MSNFRRYPAIKNFIIDRSRDQIQIKVLFYRTGICVTLIIRKFRKVHAVWDSSQHGNFVYKKIIFVWFANKSSFFETLIAQTGKNMLTFSNRFINIHGDQL